MRASVNKGLIVDDPATPDKNNKLTLSLDLRVIIILLLVIIVGMLCIWKPWQDNSASASSRTISVSGEAKITAVPDEYVFSPDYQFKNQSKDAALADVTKKSDDITKQLKQLGVADNKIKTASDGYNYSDYFYDSSTGLNTYSLRLTVTVNDKKLAQKVQDYLITTAPTGSVSPSANFSDAKRKQLQDQARDQATKDARAKADQSAANLGFKIGKVKSVTDSDNFGGPPIAYGVATSALGADDASTKSLAIQPGQNDLTYTVNVVYYVK